MRTLISKLCAALAVLCVGASASAQVLPYPIAFASFKWNQPWTAPRATFTSRVFVCSQPTPSPTIALDDWLCTKPGPIIRVSWWGWLRTPAQAQRRFYIAIYRDNGNCQPLFAVGPVYSACVTPDVVKVVGKDCDPIPGTSGTHTIYYLSAKMPTPYFQQQGTPTAPQHYWIQISEEDETSVQFGVEDFRWAGRRPILVCPAMQAPPVLQPIRDACDQIEDDLSFRLYSRTTIIAVPTGGVGSTLKASLLSPNGEVLESRCVDVGPDGTTDVDFDSPDGTYMLEISGMGTLRRRAPLVLAEGQEFRPSFFDIFYGDLDDDGFINTRDLVQLLGGFGQSAH